MEQSQEHARARRPVGAVLPWVVAGVAALVAAAVILPSPLRTFVDGMLPSSVSETRSSQVVESVTLQEEVVLLGLTMQGIISQENATALNGMNLPGTAKEVYVQFTFTAKLGLDGRDVAITETGEGRYLVSVPEFVYVGQDDTAFEVVVEDNGLLSWITPDIDVLELASTVPSDQDKADYISLNEQALREQTEAFYRGIIGSVDPEAVLTFEFAGSPMGS